ncbi:MAG: pyridoxamine 5'-phosphate oxidase family protein, partial [Bacteroidales bacterium]|nr:pyridoxamine 5'-phosphate oxidase family protein [Bacteroidales bacterium]
MRRTDKELIDIKLIENIIKQSLVCRLALSKNNMPYLVPVSFGYDGKNIYVHTAKEGKKIDYLESNNIVCFEFDINVKTIEHESVACKWTTAYQSVIGFGKMFEITDFLEAKYALNQIMMQYSGKEWELNEKMLSTVKMWKIEIEEMTGKESAMKMEQ